MQHLADLLASIPLPIGPLPIGPVPGAALSSNDPADGSPLRRLRTFDTPLGGAPELVHDLGADLPAGHLHVWGGPRGAGKTSFLLSLLHAAAARGRRVTYATYDLAPESLALRMLAMAAHLELDALPDPGGSCDDCTLTPEGIERARASRASLSRLPFFFLAARGFSVDSIRDRIVRMPFRAEVLAVDYLQGVIREPGTDMGVALRALSDLAAHLHVAIICAVQPRAGSSKASGDRHGESSQEANRQEVDRQAAEVEAADVVDRMGWIAPREAPIAVRDDDAARSDDDAREGTGATTRLTTRLTTQRSAEVVQNRHGVRHSVPLELDEANGNLERAPSE